MFYRKSKAAIYALAGISLASLGSAALADVLVTQSAGAVARQHPRGTRIADNTSIVLGTGDSLTVLTGDGMRRYRGPGRYRIGGARQLAGSALAGSTSRGVARTGVSRGELPRLTGEIPPDHPMYRKVWQVDIGHSGPFCLVEGQSATLWREDAEAPLDVTLERVPGGTSHALHFDAGQWAIEWPNAIAGEAGAEYRISWPGAEQPTTVTFAPLAVEATDQVAVGAALYESGCHGQLDALVAHSERVGGTEQEGS